MLHTPVEGGHAPGFSRECLSGPIDAPMIGLLSKVTLDSLDASSETPGEMC